MASADLLVELFPRDVDRVGDGRLVTLFLNEAARQGYLVLEKNAFALIEELGAANAWKPGIRDEVQSAIAAYTTGVSDIFDCYLRYCPPADEDYGLFFRLTLFRGETILLGVNDGTFKYNELGLINYSRFITFVSLVYQTWPPLYGYMSDGPSWSLNEARSLSINALYELTIFGPEYVSKIGPEKFDALRVWRDLRMEDGGHIVAVGLYAHYTDPTIGTGPLAVAAGLGLAGPDFMQ